MPATPPPSSSAEPVPGLATLAFVLPPELAALYTRLDPPHPASEAEFQDPEFVREREAAAWLWRRGGYRCGITAHLIFFLLAPGFVHIAHSERPRRFGRLHNFARSFDFTDTFIKRATASGRGENAGLADPTVRADLVRIQAAHDRLAIPHWQMVHFGYRLMQQLEADLDAELRRKTGRGLSATHRHYHLRYMARLYRAMGIPYSTDRTLLDDFCAAIEHRYARFTPISAEYGRRLLFLGLTVGVPCDRASLARNLPPAIRPLFERHYAALRPAPGWRVLGRLLNLLHYPRRRYRNPRPGPLPAWLQVADAGNTPD